MEAIKYADDLLKLIGFKHIADYESCIYYDQITCDTIEKINGTMGRFKPLFKQRNFNLSRYNYKLTNITQLIGFVKKVLQQLDVNHEVIRHCGQNAMRLKPPNKLLNDYIMNQEMSSSSQNVQSQLPLKNVTMSTMVSGYLSKDRRGSEVVSFYKDLILNDIKTVRDVITSIYCSHNCILKFLGNEVLSIPADKTIKMYLPISLLKHTDIKIVSEDTDMFTSVTVESAFFNKLRCNIDEYCILLDDNVFNSNFKVYRGIGSQVLNGNTNPVIQSKPSTKQMVIRNTPLNVMTLDKTMSEQGVIDYALCQLLKYQWCFVNAVRANYKKELTISYMLNGASSNHYDLYYKFEPMFDVTLNIDLGLEYKAKVYCGECEKSIDGNNFELFRDRVCNTMLVIEDVPFDKLYYYRTQSVILTGLFLDINFRKKILLKEGV